MNPLVSIVIPCYEQGIYLEDAVKSVLAQSYQNWEVVIVNDGSCDCTEQVALIFSRLDKRISYLYQENKGVCAARNNGFSLCRGKYHVALDADDTLEFDYLSKAVKYLEDNTSCALYYGKYRVFGDKNGTWNLSPYSCYNNFLLGNCIPNGNVYRRSDYLRVGGYDLEMKNGHDDWEFLIRLLYHNDNVYCSSEITYNYRIVEKRDSDNLTKIMARNRTLVENYIFSKHIDKYLEYFENPIYIYRQYNVLSSFASRRTSKLLFILQNWYQKCHDLIISLKRVSKR